MLNKFMIALIGIVMAALFVCKQNPAIVEGYLNFPLTVKRVQGNVGAKSQAYCQQQSLKPKENYIGNGLGTSAVAKTLLFTQPTYKEKFIPPRFQTGLPGTMKLRLQEDQLAVPYSSTSVEGFKGSERYCSPDGNGVPVGGGPSVQSDYTAGNYAHELIGGDAEEGYEEDGEDDETNEGQKAEDVVNMNRFMFTTARRGIGYGQGDPIRGDLPIVPCGPAWFRPSSDPSRDLRQGALAVMGGSMNDTATELAKLQAGGDYGLGGTHGGIAQSSSGGPMTVAALDQLSSAQQITQSAMRVTQSDVQHSLGGPSGDSDKSQYGVSFGI